MQLMHEIKLVLFRDKCKMQFAIEGMCDKLEA